MLRKCSELLISPPLQCFISEHFYIKIIVKNFNQAIYFVNGLVEVFVRYNLEFTKYFYEYKKKS